MATVHHEIVDQILKIIPKPGEVEYWFMYRYDYTKNGPVITGSFHFTITRPSEMDFESIKSYSSFYGMKKFLDELVSGSPDRVNTTILKWKLLQCLPLRDALTIIKK